MSLMNIVEVAIGLTLVYAIVSTLCSGINEWLAQRWARRGGFLRRGLLLLLTDRWIYLRFVNHPAIVSLYRERPGRKRHPSYIPSDQFASALFDLVTAKASTIKPLTAPPDTSRRLAEAARICADAGFTAAKALVPLIDTSVDSLEASKKNVAAWYEATMDRVSGWYKQHARLCLFWVGLAVAICLNIDSLAIGRSLIRSDSLRTTIADQAAAIAHGATAAKELGKVDEVPDLKDRLAQVMGLRTAGLPLGYACLEPSTIAGKVESIVTPSPSVVGSIWAQIRAARGSCAEAMPSAFGLLAKLAGWLITAVAVSLGAPFWFDLINKLASIRGAGPKPAPKMAA